MRIAWITGGVLVFLCVIATRASAEYAVLRSGVRMHITGYERVGAMVRLHVSGGVVDLPADEVLNIEPEEIFAPVIVPLQSLNVPFSELIRVAAAKYGLDPLLVASVVSAESNFNPRAVSVKNAQGLMQLMPETSLRFGVRNPFDAAQSIDAGARYLKELLERFHGDVKLALAAYNAGPERVDQYQGVPPYRETRDYVRRVTDKLPTTGNPNPTALPPPTGTPKARAPHKRPPN